MKSSRLIAVTLLLTVFVVAVLTSCGGKPAPTPTLGGRPPWDPLEGNVKWKFTMEGAMGRQSPVIVSDGTVYVQSGNALYAVNPNGTLKWKFNVDVKLSSPALGADGTIYVQDENSTLYAINPDGAQKWQYTLTNARALSETTPAIGSDGTIYAVADGMYAISSEGKLKWSRRAGEIRSSPAIASDGTIHIGTSSPSPTPAWLWAIKPDGTLKWECLLKDADFIYSSPAIGADGTVYIGAETEEAKGLSFVYAVRPDGTLKWRYDITGRRPVRASPTVGVDGTIYVGTKAGYVNADFLAINPDGTLKWKYTMETVHGVPDDIYAPAAIGADGKVYFGVETGFIYALNPNGTLAWKYEARIKEDSPEGYIKSGAISGGGAALHSDGALYFVASYAPPGAWIGPWAVINVLFAFRTDSPGLANSPWPKFQYDNQNTGRAGQPR